MNHASAARAVAVAAHPSAGTDEEAERDVEHTAVTDAATQLAVAPTASGHRVVVEG